MSVLIKLKTDTPHDQKDESGLSQMFAEVFFSWEKYKKTKPSSVSVGYHG